MNKIFKLSVLGSILLAQAGNFGCSGSGANREENKQVNIPYDTPAVRFVIYTLYAEFLIQYDNALFEKMKPELDGLSDYQNAVKEEKDETKKAELVKQYETKHLQILKKYMDIGDDFFEVTSPVMLINLFVRSGGALVSSLSPQELCFFWYVIRMRYLMFAFMSPKFRNGEIGMYVDELTEAFKRNLPDDNPKLLADILDAVVNYEKQHPFNYAKYKEETLKKFPNHEAEDLPPQQDFEQARQKVITIFEHDINILRNLKEGQTFAEAAAELNAQEGIVEYELGLAMHPLYPIEPFFTLVNLDENGDNVREVFPQPATGWTYPLGGSSHLSADGAKPLPKKLDMVYYSIAENKCYSLEEPLPFEKLKAMFVKKNPDGDPLYRDLIFGAAPYGGVAVWTQRSDNFNTELVAWLKGKETKVDFADFSRGLHTVDGNNWEEFRANALKQYPLAEQNLAVNGLPAPDLFEQFNEKFNTSFKVEFKVPVKEGTAPEDIVIESVKLRYFNGESETLSVEDLGKPAMRAKIKEAEIHFKDGKNENSSYLYVDQKTAADNKSIREFYQKVFAENPAAEGVLSFGFEGRKPWLITLAADGKTSSYEMEEIRFRNKFEDYRTPVYYQPQSFWKGQKPEAEEKPQIPSGGDINLPDKDGLTPLIKAIKYPDEEEAFAKLLRAGADVNIKSAGGDTPLCLAVSYNKKDMVKALLEAGADVNAADGAGRTPLMNAAMIGVDTDIVAMLLEKGADANMDWQSNGMNTGMTALSLALDNKQNAIAELLKKYGAVLPEKPAPASAAPMPSAENINTPDAMGYTPLMHALMAGDSERVKQLIAAGADVNIKVPAIGTPLLFACTSGNTVAAKALIDAKADLNAAGDNGFTPLMMACQTGNKDLAEMLIKAGADVNIQHSMNGQNTGLNALKMAQNGGFEDIISLLKSAGAKE